MSHRLRRGWVFAGFCLGLGAALPVLGRADDGLKKEIENSLGMKLVLIPAGTFTMGAPKSEDGRHDNEGPPHHVEITRPFYMAVYPVTKGQFAAFVNDDGYVTEAEKINADYTWRKASRKHRQTDDEPVVYVTWNDTVRFCQWLSEKEKSTYELPTEAEWEYACRAGTTTAFSFGDDVKILGEYAWYCDNSEYHTHPVGGKKPNPWGLNEMYGNVCQWCADSERVYRDLDPQQSLLKDPVGPERTKYRIVRGGSWALGPENCRSAARSEYETSERFCNVGFRVVLRVSARGP